MNTLPTTEPTLKLCPFCGKDDAYLESDDSCWVVCDSCGVSTAQFETEEDAREAWNRRSHA